MSRPRRVYISKYLYFATDRIAYGLPLVPCPLINSIIEGILAEGAHRFEVRLFGYLFMGNHYHLIFQCLDAERAAAFFSYIKGEIARSLNKLMGRRGSLWQGRTDSPVILDYEKAKEMLVYLYTNPQVAGLVSRIDDYPGVNSWGLSRDRVSKTVPRFNIRDLRKIDRQNETSDRDALYRELLSKEDNKYYELGLSSVALEQVYFEDCESFDLSSLIKEREEQICTLDRSFVGRASLIGSSLFRRYNPTKYGRRTYCLAAKAETRRIFLAIIRSIKEVAREVFCLHRLGDYRKNYPPGIFPPRSFCQSNLLSVA